MYNILICDDEKDIVSALKIYLAAEGYGTYEARNGREALELLEENDIHLILMDIMMPELDGIAATAVLREKNLTELLGGSFELILEGNLFKTVLTFKSLR